MSMVTAEQLRQWIDQGELWKFYKTKEWMKLKESVLRAAHYECQECRAHGKITRYDTGEDGTRRRLSTVHHVMRVRDHPELALSKTYRDLETGEVKVNLVSVCKACHNKLHPEKRKNRRSEKESFTNLERW